MIYQIRNPNKEETEILCKLADFTGIFDKGEVQALLGATLEEYFKLNLGINHLIWVIEKINESKIVGWAYFAESSTAPGVWDVWWFGIDPNYHGIGASEYFINSIESQVSKLNGRVIVIETSSDERLDRARAFYSKKGYELSRKISDFYAKGISKIIFSKTINLNPLKKT